MLDKFNEFDVQNLMFLLIVLKVMMKFILKYSKFKTIILRLVVCDLNLVCIISLVLAGELVLCHLLVLKTYINLKLCK